MGKIKFFMKNVYLFLCLGVLFLVSSCGSNRVRDDKQLSAPTVILVRHAEKASGENPDLTLEGKARAQRLAVMLQNIPLQAVYSTNTRRTLQTAQPTADDHRLSVDKYDGDQLAAFAQKLIRQSRGKTILVVGHSNTTPALAGMLAPGQTFAQFEDSDYDQVWIVVNAGEPKAQVIKLHM